MDPGSIRYDETMTTRIHRRDFLRLAVVTVAASAVPLAGCGDTSSAQPVSTDPADVARVFPQGIASGDPSPESVILWTRVEGAAAGDRIAYEIALDEAFTQVVARGETSTDADRDHTVRIKPVGLSPYTTYWYRFVGLGVASPIGRTKTAPEPGQDVPVRFAFASCQDFVGRWYHSWRALVERHPDDLDFVVHLGDYVYETDGDPDFQTVGGDRAIKLPDGLPLGDSPESGRAALTLADYRSIYRQYRSDEWLRRAHQLYPFVNVWDDHEFANDSWQDHATHFNEKQGDEKSPAQREAADRAWFENQPADVVFDEAASYPDDIRIYRGLRFGRHVEMFMIDDRYYRDDHLVPEGPADLSVGKFAANSSLGSRNFVLKSGFDEREAAARPTLLGAAQKDWLLGGVAASDATWKILGSGVQLSQMAVDLSSFELLPAQFKAKFYFSCDQWDGYRSERADLLRRLAPGGNLVSIAGDIHAFYASELHVDFDAPSAVPAAVEFVVAGISSASVQEITQATVDSNPTLSALGLGSLVGRFDSILADSNPHNVFANSLANGVAVMTVDRASAIEVEFLQVPPSAVREASWDGAVQVARFRVAGGSNRIQKL